MNKADICRIIAGVLVLLVGVAVGFGGLQLRRGPETWPDVIADEATVRRASVGMIVGAALLIIAAIATLAGALGSPAAAVVIVALVAAAFLVNRILFGNMRLSHTLVNVAVAAMILALLWVGYGQGE